MNFINVFLQFIGDRMYYLLVVLVIWLYLRYWGPVFVKFKKDNDKVRSPERAYHTAACWDVFACEKAVIPPQGWKSVPFGITIAPAPHFHIPFLGISIMPFGNVACKIHTRSGMALKKGLRNHLGIIDADYRESLSAIIFNPNTYPISIKEGDKVAQLEFYRVPSIVLWESNKLSDTYRGKRGFGSSGK